MRRFLLTLAALAVLGGAVVPQVGLAQSKMTAKTTKKMPARDSKTGKFVKKPGKMGMSKMSTKKMPPRDPKTGKFMKKKS